MKKPQYFIQNPDSGEPMLHCGSDLTSVMASIGYMIEADLHELQEDGDEATFIISRKDMTDEEVDALPDY